MAILYLCKEEQMYWLSFANCYIVESGVNPDDCDKVGIMDNIGEELQVLLLTDTGQSRPCNFLKILVTRQDCHRALAARYNIFAESSHLSIHCVW